MADDLTLKPVAIERNLLPSQEQSLFVQAALGDAEIVAPILASTGVGVVYTFRPNFTTRTRDKRAARVVTETRKQSPTTSILLDANRYKGKARKTATDGLDAGWTTRQHGLGLPWALTDSGYAATVDDVALLLDAARSLQGQIIVVLPIPGTLLAKNADQLVSLVEAQGHPVALVLEDGHDPLDSKAAVHGLVRLLDSSQHVGLLRSDMAALGAILHGGAFGAVGVRSGLRHLYKPGGGGQPSVAGAPPPLHIYLPQLMTFVHQDKFVLAYTTDPTLPVWRCDCDVCGGKTVDGSAWHPIRPQQAQPTRWLLSRISGTRSWQRLPRSLLANTGGTCACTRNWPRRVSLTSETHKSGSRVRC